MGNAVREALSVAVQMGQPVLLWGGPGEGKSAVVEQVAAQLGRPCEVVIGSVREASDFAGLPMRVGDSVSFVPPRWASRCIDRPDTVVFLDELTTAQPSVQAAMLRVVLEREVGDLSLPDTVSIVAAANPPETSAGGDDLSAPLANRFCHLDWEADLGQWVSGMLRGWEPSALPVVPSARATHELRWRALVAAFIKARPSLLRLVPTDAVSQGHAWPSPRTWDRVHRVAAAADAASAGKAVRAILVEGLVGPGAAIEFLRYAEEVDLPDPDVEAEEVTGANTQQAVALRDAVAAAGAGRPIDVAPRSACRPVAGEPCGGDHRGRDGVHPTTLGGRMGGAGSGV